MRRGRVGAHASEACETRGEELAGVRKNSACRVLRKRWATTIGSKHAEFFRPPASPPAPSRRASPRPARAALAIAAALLGTATLGFTMAGGSAAGPIASTDAAPVLLIHTGEQRGHLEPCGCTQPQIGGLPRRAAYLASLPAD